MHCYLSAIFIEGNMVALTIGGGCLALILSVFLAQQIDDD
ncbi:hypothetical protein DFR28_102479 [Arenicella xantha]|uniref:Uncharacterized protein n=1 Tax=Arenicella xantha TaxID=644221 RepID=A0A395JQR5_9GAMM|nr:hypothetical protein DFR28_102479 [Arenicella xantha]